MNTVVTELAKAIVQAVVSNMVELVKKVPILFRRLSKAKRRQRVAQLEATTTTALATATGGDLDQAMQRQQILWEERLGDLVAEHPQAADELRELLADIRTVLPTDGVDSVRIVQQVRAGRDAFTAGRDQHFGTDPHRQP